MKIFPKLLIGFLTISLLVVANGYLSLNATGQIEDLLLGVRGDAKQVINSANEIASDAKRAEDSMMLLLMFNDLVARDIFFKRTEALSKHFSILSNRISDRASRETLNIIQKHFANLIIHSESLIEQYEQETISQKYFDFQQNEDLVRRFHVAAAETGRAAVKLGNLTSALELLPVEKAQDAILSIRQRIYWIIMLTVIFSIALGYLISRSISNPLQNLARVVTRYGEGQSDIKFETTTSDELGDLGVAFNRMVDDINSCQSELVGAQQDLIRSERLAALGTVISTVSHEIRNPLGTIRTALYSIRKRLEGQNTGINKTLDRAERSVNRCDRIIEELLEYSRNSKLVKNRTIIDEWIKKVIKDHKIDPSVNLMLEADSGTTTMLDQVCFEGCLLNLINNACQSMLEREEEGARRDLIVATSRQDDEIVIKISDTGPGIKAENIDKIFEPMFSTRAFGVGLGLPIVKKVIEKHRGRVEIDSQPGEGTVVTLWLPIDKTEET
jgi:signal transduction histidine kinase